jgi:hypothetical protein
MPSVRDCGTFAGVGSALLCFVVLGCNGRPWQVIEITTRSFLDRPHNAGVEGSSPSLSII